MVSPTRTGAQHPQHLGSSILASFRVACMAHTRGNSVRRWAKQGARAEGGRHDCVWFCGNRGKQVSGRRFWGWKELTRNLNAIFRRRLRRPRRQEVLDECGCVRHVLDARDMTTIGRSASLDVLPGFPSSP